MKKHVGLIVLLAVIVTFFQVGNKFQPILIPALAEVVAYLWNGENLITLLSSAAMTSCTVLASFVASIFLALPIGVMLGLSSTGAEVSDRGIDFFRSIPPSALVPVGILLIGTGQVMYISLTTFAISLILIVMTREAIHSLPSFKVNMISRSQWSKFRLLIFVLIPSVLGSIRSSSRVLVSLALALVVVCEILVGQIGIGAQIRSAQLRLDVAGLYVFLLLAGLVGTILNQVVSGFFRLIEEVIYKPLTFKV